MVTSRDPQYSVALHSSPGGLKIDTLLLHQQISLFSSLLVTTDTSHNMLHVLLAVTIEPERLLQLRSEHGPGADYQSHLVGEYTERRSDPQREITSPDGHDNMKFESLKADDKSAQLTCVCHLVPFVL